MSGDSNRRNFLKAMGLTAVATVVPVSLGAAGVAAATPAASGGSGALELWLLDTGAGVLDAGLYGSARQGLVTSLQERGQPLPY